MKGTITFTLLVFFNFIFCQNIPVTKKTQFSYTKHNIFINDDYSWLEYIKSEEVNLWADAQNAALDLHLILVKKKYNAEPKIKNYVNLSSNSLPTKKEKYFYSKYIKDKNTVASLYYRKTLESDAIELVNPLKIYKDNNAVINSYYPSKNSTTIAYGISLDGSDKFEVGFSDIKSYKVLDDKLKDVKFSNIAWNNDKGVFYKRNFNKNSIARDSTFALYYHIIGARQDDDKLIYDTSKKENSINYFTADNKLFIDDFSKNSNSRSCYYYNLNGSEFKKETIIENDTTGFKFLNYHKNRIYYSTPDYDWGEIKSFDINNRADNKSVISQMYNHLLVSTDFYDNYIVCKYKTVEKYILIVYDSDGNFVRKFDTPNQIDFDVKFYDSESKDLFVNFYSYTLSPQNFKLNLETGNVRRYYNDYLEPTQTIFPFDHFVTKSITFKSRDNEDVPITIIYKKNTPLDGNNPILLEAYGGFGVVTEPRFDPGLLHFLEKGGVYAFAEIRGGGEKGLKWHRKAVRLNKMKSFNDFVDAAEFLIKEKYTSPKKLAISGSSYGGLVVGVAITQRPELFKVAVPKVGVFDMLTFDKYSVGRYHLNEFGNPSVKKDFENLLTYSPYYQIKNDVNYPTCMIITGENDDRVPPINSYKFAAKLQNRAAQKNPIYLKVQKNAGHNGKIATNAASINEEADFYNFILYHLNE